MANTNSNAYTFTYAAVMTLLVAVALAGVSTGLKPLQDAAKELDKKNQILNAVAAVDKVNADAEYNQRIKELVVSEKGTVLSGAKAFDVDLKKEYKKASNDRKLPVYVYTHDDGQKNYILPLSGAGLWDAIGGYIALGNDLNTIVGSSFNHVGETPGLGAEIATDWFQSQFKGRKIADGAGAYKINVLKGRGNAITPVEKYPYKVDGISGATITCDGVNAMLEKGYASYAAYFKSMKK